MTPNCTHADPIRPGEAFRDFQFDPAEILARVGGDMQIVVEVVEMCLTDFPNMMSSIRVAVADGNAEAVERHAHKLRGALGHITIRCGYETAGALEMAARDRRLEDTRRAFELLELKMERLATSLKGFLSRQV